MKNTKFSQKGILLSVMFILLLVLSGIFVNNFLKNQIFEKDNQCIALEMKRTPYKRDIIFYSKKLNACAYLYYDSFYRIDTKSSIENAKEGEEVGDFYERIMKEYR